jgi:hypothetical protein
MLIHSAQPTQNVFHTVLIVNPTYELRSGAAAVLRSVYLPPTQLLCETVHQSSTQLLCHGSCRSYAMVTMVTMGNSYPNFAQT